MTQFSPTLIVKRVVIERGDKAVYDEKFHTGVNVIRGQNSSGTSTIMNFLMYGLGGDLTEVDWSEHAKLCSRVLIEAEFDGKLATLSREVSPQRGQPMEISIHRSRHRWIENANMEIPNSIGEIDTVLAKNSLSIQRVAHAMGFDSFHDGN